MFINNKFYTFQPRKDKKKNLSENNYNIFNNCLYIVSVLKQFISSIKSRALKAHPPA